jgi:hypothetical protein
MRKGCLWLLIAAFSLWGNAYAQPSKSAVKVALLDRGLDNEIIHLLDVLPLFVLDRDSVVQPIDMSADYPGMLLRSYAIQLPTELKITAVDDLQIRKFGSSVKGGLAYGFANHNHGIGIFPNHTLILMERPQGMRYRKTRVWVDLNHNLDLTDDVVQYYTPSSVAFSEKKVPTPDALLRLDTLGTGVKLQLGFFQAGELRSYQKLYADAVDLVKGNRVFCGVTASFRQRRLNVICGQMVHHQDTLYWALKDVNLNGLYNDLGVDVVMVSNNAAEFNTANAWTLQKGGAVLDWLGQGWKVIPQMNENPKRGSSQHAEVNQNAEGGLDAEWLISVAPIGNKEVKNSRSLLVGDKIPNFKFCVIEGAYKVGKLKENPVHRRKIRKFKGKYTLLVVWNADDVNFHKDSAALHALTRNLPDSVQVIMLNHGGSGRYVYGYNRRFETQMIHGFCSPQVTELLKLQTMPQNFLIDPKQRLIDINVSPFELFDRINGTLR